MSTTIHDPSPARAVKTAQDRAAGFVITLEPLASTIPVEIRLRQALKLLLRGFNLRCIDVREAGDGASGLPKNGRGSSASLAGDRGRASVGTLSEKRHDSAQLIDNANSERGASC